MGARRIRQHVNPLSGRYIVERAQLAARPAGADARPPEVELGCADGTFTMRWAAADPARWVVGLDIREPILEQARVAAARGGLHNAAFAYVNLAVDLHRVFAPRSVARFHLLFPDPWFKPSHAKRRVMSPNLVGDMAALLVPGGEVHVASDVFELGLEMMAELEGEAAEACGLRNVLRPWAFWRGNPFPGQSRREDTTLARGQRVWRARYRFDPST